MKLGHVLVAASLLATSTISGAQTANQIQLKIDSSDRTLAVSAQGRVTADPEIAILHIGFGTQPADSKTAYADGTRTSNAIVASLKQAGIAESAIRSESQHLSPEYNKPHKFRFEQEWTVKVAPARVAEILDIAVTAGATDSGQIDWTMQDEKALEDQALDRAAARAMSDAAVLAKVMGVHLGSLLYSTNQIQAASFNGGVFLNNSAGFADQPQVDKRSLGAPASIEPRKVSRIATVYAVFAIE